MTTTAEKLDELHDVCDKVEDALADVRETLLYALAPQPHRETPSADEVETAVAEFEAACMLALPVLRRHAEELAS